MPKHVSTPHTAHLESISKAIKDAIEYEEKRIKTLKLLERGTSDKASLSWKSKIQPHKDRITQLEAIALMVCGVESIAITHKV